eukprot:scaffold1911_cov397-Prasinococcus_capsulatus_cf.AAC.29
MVQAAGNTRGIPLADAAPVPIPPGRLKHDEPPGHSDAVDTAMVTLWSSAGVPGCLDSKAWNYNEAATMDDRSCLYLSRGQREALPRIEESRPPSSIGRSLLGKHKGKDSAAAVAAQRAEEARERLARGQEMRRRYNVQANQKLRGNLISFSDVPRQAKRRAHLVANAKKYGYGALAQSLPFSRTEGHTFPANTIQAQVLNAFQNSTFGPCTLETYDCGLSFYGSEGKMPALLPRLSEGALGACALVRPHGSGEEPNMASPFREVVARHATVLRCAQQVCSVVNPQSPVPTMTLKLNAAAYSAMSVLSDHIFQTLTPMPGCVRVVVDALCCGAEAGVKTVRAQPSEAFIHLLALLHSKLCERLDVYGYPGEPVGHEAVEYPQEGVALRIAMSARLMCLVIGEY